MISADCQRTPEAAPTGKLGGSLTIQPRGVTASGMVDVMKGMEITS